MAYPACNYGKKILETDDADCLEEYVDGVNELFYISEYLKLHNYILRRIEEEGYFQLVSKQVPQRSGMIQPLIHHIFTTRGIVEDLVDTIIAREIVTNDMSQEVYNNLGHREKRQLLCSHVSDFNYQSDFKFFVDIRNSLAHDRGKQFQFEEGSDKQDYGNPAKIVREAKMLVDKLCIELYDENIREISKKSPDSHGDGFLKGILSDELELEDSISDVSTLAIIEWCFETDQHNQENWELVREELVDRGYNPNNLEEVNELWISNFGNELSWSEEISDEINITYFDIYEDKIEIKMEFQTTDVESSFGYLKLNDRYIRRKRDINTKQKITFNLPTVTLLEYGAKNLIEVGVGAEKDGEVGGDRIRALYDSGSFIYENIVSE